MVSKKQKQLASTGHSLNWTTPPEWKLQLYFTSAAHQLYFCRFRHLRLNTAYIAVAQKE